MHSRFNELRKTHLGQELESLLSSSKKYVEYAALSRAGLPAIAAAVHELEDMFPIVKSDQAARQFCGAVVGEVMRDAGHEILRPRGRVAGNLFTYGTVWTPFPIEKNADQIVQAMSGIPQKLTAMLRDIPARFLRLDLERDRTPVSNRIVEMICTDAEFHRRIDPASPAVSEQVNLEALLADLASEDGTLNVAEFSARFESGRDTLCNALAQRLTHVEASDHEALNSAIRRAHDADQVLLNDLQEYILELSFGS